MTQVVVHDDALLKDLHRETAITVSGKVVARDEETVNPKIPTGRLEVLADALEVLGPCVPNLPFDVQDSTDTREEVRLKYRFLDLRNPRVHDNILFPLQSGQLSAAQDGGARLHGDHYADSHLLFSGGCARLYHPLA